MWKQNWTLIAQYCLPSIIILLVVHAIFRFLGSRQTSNHTALVQRVLAKALGVRQLDRSLRLSSMLRAATQWTQDRLELALFTLVDLVYLTLCTITLKGFMCVELEGAYRLQAETSLLCWSHDHLPVGIFSVLVFPFLLFYPVFVYNYMQDRLEALKNVSATVPKRRVTARVRFARVSKRVSQRVFQREARWSVRLKAGRGLLAGAINQGGHNRTKGRTKAGQSDKAVTLKAGGLSGRSFDDEYKPVGMAYAPVFRLCLAVFASVSVPSSLYRLILASLPLLFFGLIVVRHPFTMWWMNACNPCPACPLSPSCCSQESACSVAHGLRRPLQGMR